MPRSLRPQYDQSEKQHKNKQGTNTSSSFNKSSLCFYHTNYTTETKKQLALCNINISMSHLEGQPVWKHP